MSDDKQNINLHLDAHTVRLEVKRSEEQYYRLAATKLNERYQMYQRRNPRASTEQLWMYVALDMGVNLYNDAREKSLKPVETKLQELNAQLSDLLNETNNN